MTTYNLTPGAGSVPPVPTTQPTNLFRFGEQSIWSTQLLAGNIANANLRLFSTPQSQTGQGFGALSIAETNLKIGGMVPQGVGYDVYGVATQVVMTQGNLATSPIGRGTNTAVLVNQLLNIIHNGVLTWDFTQSQIDICPVALAGGGGGTYGALAGAGADVAGNEFIGNLSNGNGGIWRYMTHPVTLPGQSVFAVLLRFGALATAINGNNQAVVRVLLLGKYKNVIEIG
jgi:hypothetical protein